MAKIKIINADAEAVSEHVALIFTDPPYDMSGKQLARILGNFSAPHLVLITTMRQLLEFVKHTDKELAFDFVLDAVVPKKSMSIRQPNYVHQTGVYLKSPGVASAFNRKRAERSDTFDGKGYWPTILRAQRENMREHGMAKNEQAMTDILAAFDCETIADPFAGTGTTGLAAFAADKQSCVLVEREKKLCDAMMNKFKFLGCNLALEGLAA